MNSIDLSNHLEENRNGQVIETPIGWVMFWRPDEKSMYIDDISVFPEFRHLGFVVDLASIVEQIAIAEGRNMLYTNIHPTVDGADRMHEIVVRYGFVPYLVSEIINVYRKELK